MPLSIFSSARSISRCAHLPQLKTFGLAVFCFFFAFPQTVLRAIWELLYTSSNQHYWSGNWPSSLRSHRGNIKWCHILWKKMGCIPPPRFQMVAQWMPACAAGFWQSWRLTVWLAHFSFHWLCVLLMATCLCLDRNGRETGHRVQAEFNVASSSRRLGPYENFRIASQGIFHGLYSCVGRCKKSVTHMRMYEHCKPGLLRQSSDLIEAH